MNHKKMIAAVAIATLAFGCLFGLLVTDDDEAADGAANVITKHPKVKTEVASGNTIVDMTITTTQASIDNALVTNSSRWCHWEDTSSPRVTTALDVPGAPSGKIIYQYTKENVKLEISTTDNAGIFQLAFKADGATYNGAQTEFLIAYELTTTGKGVYETSVVKQVLYYQIILESATDIEIQDGTNAKAATIKLGKPMTAIQLHCANDSINGLWYADNLPKGVAMSTTGAITGVPSELVELKVAKVYVTDFSGNVHKGTYTFTVEGSSELKIQEVTGAKYIGPDSNSKNINRYMMYTGDKAIFQVKMPTGEDSTEVGLTTQSPNGVSGYISYNSGDSNQTPITFTKVEANVFTFQITPTGTGDLTVVFEKGTEMAMFTILVINKIDDVKAEIFFDLQPSKK